ncbi:OmpA family protein [Lishizhenia sp.]|uniref:OmpA family protein n=1 Tax=Lishizhenia sp. TaxID=2497594 RepID=UPI00299D20C6|nr:OmpA family protein [Lishizhenia sp.]MDX1446299.1 OmpA family protein [Lishizhenia sp.]
MKSIICVCLLLFSGITFGQETQTFSFYFESNRATFSSLEFKKVAQLLDTVLVQQIKITASCDDVGSVKSNMVLSQKRADFVKSYLVNNLMLEGHKIETQALGEIALKDSTLSFIEQRKNNRVATLRVSYNLKQKREGLDKAEPIVEKKSVALTNVVKGDKIRLEAIQFVGGKDEFLNSAYPILNELLRELRNNPEVKIEIQGHVCCMKDGGEGVNLVTGRKTLSEDRAKAVYDYLVQRGIEEDRLSYVGLKSKYQTGINNLADRRVEILIK